MDRGWSNEAAACDEFVLSTYEDYYVDAVAELLLPTGLLIDKSTQYVGSFEQYVFLYGNKEEIYSRQEIDFISSSNDIIIFTEFYKNTKRGMIPCRVIAVKNMYQDVVEYGIAFTKIINKACEGLNICVILSEEGIVFTCRSYYDSSLKNYYISDLIINEQQMEELYEKLMYSSDYDGFAEFYSYIVDSIRFKTDSPDFLSTIKKTYRLSYTFLDVLQEIEGATKLSFAREIDRYFWGLEEEKTRTYADRVEEAEEYLFKIESSRVNTMEMLFDAEEMEKMANEAEQKNADMIKDNNIDENTFGYVDLETKQMLDDPESVIKLLKKQRGI